LSDDLVARVRAVAPAGVDHTVEVAFGANVAKNVELLAPVGSMAAYATNSRTPITLKNSTETRASRSGDRVVPHRPG
jgi:NADPH:quinone reductase-like Zn-dependent oxidoreductase